MYRTIKRLSLLLLLLGAFSRGCVSEASQRVISLYAAHTENAVALGAEGLLVAVSKSDDPLLLPGLPRVPLKAGAEVFLALKPDLVLARSFSVSQNPGLYRFLENAGILVAVIDPPGYDSFADYLKELAILLETNPDRAVERFKQAADAVRKEAARSSKGKKRPLVFVESTSSTMATCAPGSWAAYLIELAGGKNAAPGAKPVSEGSAIASWGVERTIRTVKEGLDVYLVQHGAMNAATPADVKKRPWAASLANVRVAEMPEAYLSRPSLLRMEESGKMLVEIFYGSE